MLLLLEVVVRRWGGWAGKDVHAAGTAQVHVCLEGAICFCVTGER
jgi:hypothetical protein